jgi:transposase
VTIERGNRFSRGNYRCSKCGYRNQSDVIGAIYLLTRYQQGSLLPSCNARVNSGLVIKWDQRHLTCTEAPAFRQGQFTKSLHSDWLSVPLQR